LDLLVGQNTIGVVQDVVVEVFQLEIDLASGLVVWDDPLTAVGAKGDQGNAQVFGGLFRCEEGFLDGLRGCGGLAGFGASRLGFCVHC